LYSWIYIEEIAKKYNIEIRIYDKQGRRCLAPDRTDDNDEPAVMKIINSPEPAEFSEVRGIRYFFAYPIKLKTQDQILYGRSRNAITGVMTFTRPFDSFVYYSYERIILFGVMGLIAVFLLYRVLKWDPEKRLKELFDKSLK
jgi:hypothetical protein